MILQTLASSTNTTPNYSLRQYLLVIIKDCSTDIAVLDKIKRNIGFDITIVTTARTNAEAKSLLSELGMPFSDKAKKAPVPKTEEQQEEAPAAA